MRTFHSQRTFLWRWVARVAVSILFVSIPLLLPAVYAEDANTPAIFQRRLISAPADTASRPATFLSADDAFGVRVEGSSPTVLALRAAPGYYLYRDRVRVQHDGRDITVHVHFEPAESKHDATFGDVAIYHQRTRLTLPDDVTSGSLDVRYQGCAEAGLCYPPQHAVFSLGTPRTPAALASALPAAEAAHRDTPSAAPPQAALSLWTLLTLYVVGIGLTFTPCVLPMLPIACAIVVGRTPSRSLALTLSLAYVAGMVVAYTTLGAVVKLFGSSLQLQSQLERPWVLIMMAIACVIAAGWLFDLFTLRLPQRWSQRIEQAHGHLTHRRGLLSTAATGVLSTLVLSPCLSAPLAGVLVYLSTSDQVASAMLALALLALGMGTPIVLCCTFGASVLPKQGAWMETVKGLFGVMLLGSAVWLLSRLLPAPAALLLWGTLGLGLARLLGAGMPLRRGVGAVLQTLGWAVGIWSIACIVGAATNGSSPFTPLAHLSPLVRNTSSAAPAAVFEPIGQREALDKVIENRRETMPVLVDLYADWCISCKRMEQEVFSADDLQPLLRSFRTIRFDITQPDRETLAFLREHGIFGPPGLLFFVNGQEAVSYRIVGEASLSDVENRLRALLAHTAPATSRAYP